MTSPLSTVRSWRYGAAASNADAMPFHGDCERPVDHMVRGRGSDLLTALADLSEWSSLPWTDWAVVDGHKVIMPHSGQIKVRPVPTDSAYVRVRCRKCQPCLNYRRRLWTARAIAETKVSHRTWFITLTYSPTARAIARFRAENKCRQRRAEWFSDLSAANQYMLTQQETSRDVTLWFKRIRKATKAKLRYLLVSEAHADGFPHYHLLLHETDAMSVTKRVIEAQWKLGFSHCRLINTQDAKATGYVCKYLNKTASTRVRASQGYGAVEARLTERLRDATIAFKTAMGG